MSNIKKLISVATITLLLLTLNSFRIDHLENSNIPQLLPINKNDIIKISSGFGKVRNNKNQSMHKGVDFIASKGTSIFILIVHILQSIQYMSNQSSIFLPWE